MLRWVHPRSRGEYAVAHAMASWADGSSPLTRGTLTTQKKSIEALGLIPARAGNTATAYARARRDKVHPRSRGEHPC